MQFKSFRGPWSFYVLSASELNACNQVLGFLNDTFRQPEVSICQRVHSVGRILLCDNLILSGHHQQAKRADDPETALRSNFSGFFIVSQDDTGSCFLRQDNALTFTFSPQIALDKENHLLILHLFDLNPTRANCSVYLVGSWNTLRGFLIDSFGDHDRSPQLFLQPQVPYPGEGDKYGSITYYHRSLTPL